MNPYSCSRNNRTIIPHLMRWMIFHVSVLLLDQVSQLAAHRAEGIAYDCGNCSWRSPSLDSRVTTSSCSGGTVTLMRCGRIAASLMLLRFLHGNLANKWIASPLELSGPDGG